MWSAVQVHRDVSLKQVFRLPLRALQGFAQRRRVRCDHIARGATPTIPPRDGAIHWPPYTPCATRCNEAVGAIAPIGRCE